MASARLTARRQSALKRLEAHIKKEHANDTDKAALERHKAEVEILKQRIT